MILTPENYYSQEANKEFLSVSQYKAFCGSLGKLGCEAQAMAEISGEWEREKTTALYVGSYVDAHFEGTLDIFKAQTPEIFTKKMELKADYKRADEVINRIERDEYFMKFLSGKKQVIMTAEIAGAKWKCKIDSYIDDICIVDLKTTKSIRDTEYVPDVGKVDFVQFWGYDIQGAIYQEIVYQNTGKRLPFYIAAASKEPEPDIEIIQIDDEHMAEQLDLIKENVPRILALKASKIEPERCELCGYCKHTKVLSAPIHYTQLLDGGKAG